MTPECDVPPTFMEREGQMIFQVGLQQLRKAAMRLDREQATKAKALKVQDETKLLKEMLVTNTRTPAHTQALAVSFSVRLTE